MAGSESSVPSTPTTIRFPGWVGSLERCTTTGQEACLETETLTDPNLAELNEWSPKVLDTLKKLPELTDVTSDQQNRAPTETLTEPSSRLEMGPRPASR